MRSYNRLPAILSILFVLMLISGCTWNNSKTKKKETQGQSGTAWVNPRKGKIWDRVNVFEIPLTAQEYQLLGPIKSVRYAEYKTHKDGTITLIDSGYLVYDTQGHLVDQIMFDSSRKTACTATYSYNDQNRALEYNYTSYRQSKPFSEKVTFQYDSLGRISEETTVESNGANKKTKKFVYDNNGRVIQEINFDENEKIQYTTVIKYDSRGNETEYRNDNAGMRMTATYDEKGNKIEAYNYMIDSTRPLKETMINDANGWCVETDFYERDGSLKAKTKRTYDKYGNVLTCIDYHPDGTIDENYIGSHEYEYDQYGNTTKQKNLFTKNGKRKLKTMTISTFEYY